MFPYIYILYIPKDVFVFADRFLRTSIYYRSLDGLARDVKRHYLKVGVYRRCRNTAEHIAIVGVRGNVAIQNAFLFDWYNEQHSLDENL